MNSRLKKYILGEGFLRPQLRNAGVIFECSRIKDASLYGLMLLTAVDIQLSFRLKYLFKSVFSRE